MEQRFEAFTVLMNRINRNIRRIKNQEMVSYDLRSVHISCLYYLYRQEMTATELCEHCEEDKATISRALVHLEEKGFLTRNPHAKRYRSPLHLTEKGKEAGEQIAGKIQTVLDAVSIDLTQQEREALYRSLSRISSRLEALAQLEGEL